GIGCPSQMWCGVRPVLAAHYRTIALDNRGTGESHVPPGPYSVAEMASDAVAVLDAADVKAAHVFGVSMGGIVAQEFALQYPWRVRSLVLGCTSFGGPHAVRPEPAIRQFLAARASMSLEEGLAASVPYLYCTQTPRSRIEEDLAVRRQWRTRPEAYLAQFQGVIAWEAYSRLPQVSAPTLVIHGDSDRVVPPANGELLAARIPGAKCAILPRAGHLFYVDQPEATHAALVEFLASVDTAADKTTATAVQGQGR
ncbi:MAG: alpha/beta fold hydrolase, partial [Terriglobales bacterium]